jgi:hypothetical protein
MLIIYNTFAIDFKKMYSILKNNRNMKKLSLYLIFFLAVQLFFAQEHVLYDYDFAGNRVSRKIIVLESPELRKLSKDIDSIMVSDIVKDFEVRIYPNPTKGYLGVELFGVKNDNAHIVLYNQQGVALNKISVVDGYNSVDMTFFSQGWYVLCIYANDTKREYKIIKE